MKVWYLDWNTESGDRGQYGGWQNMPNETQVVKLLRERHPDEFYEEEPYNEDRTINWKLLSFELSDNIEQVDI